MSENKETTSYKNKLAYIKKYNKNNMKRIHVTFNKITEADLIEWLGEKRRVTYIKRLIKEDMLKNSK